MKPRLTSLAALVSATAATFLLASPAAAEMGLEPGAPRASTMPGGVSPGLKSESKDDWRFNFNGFMSMPVWMGFGERAADSPDDGEAFKEGDLTLHAPPVVPGERGSSAYTNVMAPPWTQLNFSYGTSQVTATVILAAKTASSAQGYFNPPDHVGIQDAFISLDLGSTGESKYQVHAGAFSSRYGTMGEYDEGQYATPVIARVQGAGVLGSARWQLGNKFNVQAEGGVVGNIDKPVLGTNPEGWNGYVDANIGSTFAGHGHLGFVYDKLFNFGLHALHSFSSDDQASVQAQPDASMTILGADARLTMGPYGHLYFGVSNANAKDIASLGSVVYYLDNPNGIDLIRNYLGAESNGTGTITTMGLQYDFSLASAMLAPEPFSGNAPDLRLSVFGMMSMTKPDVDIDRSPPINRLGICSDTCMKMGGELTYKPLSFLAVSFRGDQVMQDLDNTNESFTILSPRLLFSSDWNSQDQITLQYSNYMYGNQVAVRNPSEDPTSNIYTKPDQHTVSLHASMWW